MPKNVNTPIPETDIEGVGVFCYEFEIPNLPLWHRTAYTLISMLTRGRFWDKRTGSILDVQQIAWDVVASFKPCEGQPEICDPEIIEIIRTITTNKGCKCMSCCCGNGQGQVETNTPDTETNILPSEIPNEITQPSTTIPTDSGYDNFKCIWAKFTVDNLIGAIAEAANWAELGTLNTTESERIVFEKFGKASAYVLILERIYLLTTWVIRWLSPSVSSGLQAIIVANRGQLVDGIYCADDAQEASDNWFDILVTSQANLINKALFWIWLWMIDFPSFFADSVTRMAYRDYAHAIDTYTADCTCGSDGGDAGLPAGYVLVPMIEQSTVLINDATLSTLGELYEIMGQGNAFCDITLNEPVYEGDIVPNANRVGFFFVLESATIVNADSVSQRLANGSTQFTLVNFGNDPNTFLVTEIFAGAVSSDATLQTWLADNTYRYEDPVTVTNDGKVVMSWGFWDGTTSSGEFNECVVRCNWIINTAGL